MKEKDIPYISLDELSKKYGNFYKIILDAAKKAQEKFDLTGEIDNKIVLEILEELLKKDESPPRGNR